MLRIHAVTNAQAGLHYYDTSLEPDLYYMKDAAMIPRWEGEAAKRMELDQQAVSRDVMSDLFHNTNHQTKERLTPRTTQNRRVATDFMMSAPKSISVVWGINKEPEIIAAQDYAVREAAKFIEANAYTQENSQSERGFRQTSNLIYALFHHTTSRPVEQKQDGKTIHVPSPLIHTHMVSPNVTWNADKQRWQAVETWAIHSQAPYFEAVYHSFLSKRLNEIGYTTERTQDRYEIAGVSRSMIERFSERTKEIEKIAKEKGITDAKAKSELGVKTRQGKAKSTLSHEELHRQWTSRLSEKELHDLQNLKGQKQATSRPITAKKAIDRSLEHFLERNSGFEEKRLLAHALSLGYGHLLPGDVSKELNSRDNIIRSEINAISMMTTKEMVRSEDYLIELATSGKGQLPAINPDFEPPSFLNEGQYGAVKTVLRSNDHLTLLKGLSGVGKSTTLVSIREGIEEKNIPLLAVAPSSQAVKVLRDKGFEADTIAGLLHNKERQKQLKDGILLVDEGSLCSIPTTVQLLELTRSQNARMLMSGDTRQHSSVEYGDAMRILEDKARLTTARITKIMRQKDEDYRKVVEHLAAGRTLKGYQHLERMGAVHEIPEAGDRLEKIADDYISSVSNKRSALIVSPTHAEGALINDIIRDKLKVQKIIKGPEREFTSLKNLSLTEATKKDTASYHDKHVIRFINNQKGGYRAGTHYTLVRDKKDGLKIRHPETKELLDLPHASPENYQVYEPVKIPLATGDKIRLTNNVKSIEQTKMLNGTSYEVKGFTRSGDIKLSNGKTLAKDNLHAKYAYCDTSHSSQGKDAQDVYVSISDLSYMAASQEQLYVSVSRGTHSVKLYTSDEKDLKKAIIRSSQRITAQEIAKAQQHKLLQRKQQAYHRSLNEKIKQHEQTRTLGQPGIQKVPGGFEQRSREH